MDGEYKCVNKYKTKKMTTRSIRRPQNLFHNKLITVFYYQGYQLKLIIVSCIIFRRSLAEPYSQNFMLGSRFHTEIKEKLQNASLKPQPHWNSHMAHGHISTCSIISLNFL